MNTQKCKKDKYDANNDESFNSCETISLRNVVCDAIEDVDKTKEHSDENGHSARNTLRRHQEADPGDNDEHASREVVGDDVVGHLPLEGELEPSHRVITYMVQG